MLIMTYWGVKHAGSYFYRHIVHRTGDWILAGQNGHNHIFNLDIYILACYIDPDRGKSAIFQGKFFSIGTRSDLYRTVLPSEKAGYTACGY